MPFKSNNIYYVIAAIALIVVIIVAASASSTPPKPSPTPTSPPTIPDDGRVDITIQPNMGIAQVNVTNLMTGKTISRSIIDLPFTFTCDRGDYLRFTVTTQKDYSWNCWLFPDHSWDNSNPMYMVAKYDISLKPEIVTLDGAGGSPLE